MKQFRNLLYLLGAAVLFLAALTFVFPPKAHAQDANALCPAFADMAIVARALAIEKVEPAQAERIMRAIYSGPAMTPAVIKVMESITAYARQSKDEPGDFAVVVFTMCLQRGTPI